MAAVTATAPWHGPHESPTPMTFPLMALAVGAIVAGFVGIPAALGGGNAIEHFLEPSFTASHVERAAGEVRRTTSSPVDIERGRPRRRSEGARARGGAVEDPATRVARRGARADGASRCCIALIGILAGAEVLRDEPGDFRPTSPSALPARTACSRNKYYVDELYDATVISGTFGGGRRGCGPSTATSSTARSTAPAGSRVIGVVVLRPHRSHGGRRRW